MDLLMLRIDPTCTSARAFLEVECPETSVSSTTYSFSCLLCMIGLNGVWKKVPACRSSEASLCCFCHLYFVLNRRS